MNSSQANSSLLELHSKAGVCFEEFLWLRLQFEDQDFQPSEQENGNKAATKIGTDPRDQNIGVKGSSSVDGKPVNADEPLAYLTTVSAADNKGDRGAVAEQMPFKVPAAEMISNIRELGRALRPLNRKVDSATRFILDEENTAIAIAQTNLPMLAMMPNKERWLEIELIVEKTQTNLIWEDDISKWQHLLEQQGAFRSVRVWGSCEQKRHEF